MIATEPFIKPQNPASTQRSPFPVINGGAALQGARSVLNSARGGYNQFYNKQTSTIQTLSSGRNREEEMRMKNPVLGFLQSLIDKVKDYLEVKVRLRDPLDDNAAHLIPSSRIIATSRPHLN